MKRATGQGRVEIVWLSEPSDEAIYRALKILLGLARAHEARATQAASAVFAVVPRAGCGRRNFHCTERRWS